MRQCSFHRIQTCMILNTYIYFGHITENTSSAFSATGLYTYSNGSAHFGNVLSNEGNDFNYLTGVLTCRIPGLYLLSVTLTTRPNTEGYVHCHLFQMTF